MKTVESIIANPDSSWKSLFKETIISMIASNKNDLLWYANFLSRCEYELHFNESFVSSVYFNGKNFVIVINPLLLGIIHKDEIIAILKHSAGHMINHHFSRSSRYDSMYKEAIEVAMDVVINGNREIPYIKDIPGTGSYKDSSLKALFYQTLTEKYGTESYEVGREFEYYVELIIASEDSEEDDQSCNTQENDADSGTNSESDPLEDNNESDDSPDNDGENNSNETNTQFDEPTDALQNTEEGDEENETSIELSTSEDSNNEDDTSQKKSENDFSEGTNMEFDSLANKTLESLKNGECDIDSHEFGEQLQRDVGLEDSALDSFMDSTLKEMINDSTSFARGFTPGEATDALNRIEKRKSHKDWKKIFNKKMRNYLTNSLRYREPNKSRQHPMYPDDLDLYGYSPGKKPKLGVVLDVSGSVDDKLLIALMSEIQAIQRKFTIKNITLVQVDTQIKSIEKFGVRDKFIKRHGSGGTIMEPGFKALLQQSTREIPNMIICATDGDIEEKFEHVKVPKSVKVIWLLTEGGRLLFDTSNYPKQQMDVIALLEN